MEEIDHKFVVVNGLKLHIAEIGSGFSPVVVFLHGFPEIWYSWRYQMIAVAKAGYRAIAPDFRGYGLSDQPTQPEETTFLDLVSDLLALLDALSISKVFLVGKDFGSAILSRFVLLHGERVSGIITMGVPFVPPQPANYSETLPEGFYEPGRAEADFGRLDAKTVVRNVYILFSRSEIPIANEDQEIMDIVQPSTPLPPWFSEEDLAAYGALYEKSGFRTALQVPYRYHNSFSLSLTHMLHKVAIKGFYFDVIYDPGEERRLKKVTVLIILKRSMHEQANIKDPRIHVPVLFIAGEKDYFLKFPGVQDYISGGLKSLVPNLQMVNLPEGTHFVQEQLPDEVNQLVLDFLTKNSPS
ncbi:hypothetical protein MTR67_009449 [Solanum verrucosum]|uniref:AB hydrolase-1 domain-containing protein n=1 Tax=Solanum verrucosum TaxID=315347 RepID=A0AAF0Q381_SOLVR|nr:hypothetical protein MTR67_009449 [Solanum verrucosum]